MRYAHTFQYPKMAAICLVPRRVLADFGSSTSYRPRLTECKGHVLCANAKPSHVPLRELLSGLFFLLFSDTFETPKYEALPRVCVTLARPAVGNEYSGKEIFFFYYKKKKTRLQITNNKNNTQPEKKNRAKHGTTKIRSGT